MRVMKPYFVAAALLTSIWTILALVGIVLCEYTPFKKTGHYILAVFFPHPLLLTTYCPYTGGKCRIWNCPNFHSCGGTE